MNAFNYLFNYSVSDIITYNIDNIEDYKNQNLDDSQLSEFLSEFDFQDFMRQKTAAQIKQIALFIIDNDCADSNLYIDNPVFFGKSGRITKNGVEILKNNFNEFVNFVEFDSLPILRNYIKNKIRDQETPDLKNYDNSVVELIKFSCDAFINATVETVKSVLSDDFIDIMDDFDLQKLCNYFLCDKTQLTQTLIDNNVIALDAKGNLYLTDTLEDVIAEEKAHYNAISHNLTTHEDYDFFAPELNNKNTIQNSELCNANDTLDNANLDNSNLENANICNDTLVQNPIIYSDIGLNATVNHSNIEFLAQDTPSAPKNNAEVITPHDWQARTLSKVNSNIAEGNTRILVSAPTGAGKAFMAMFIIQMLLSQGKRVLLLIDRIKLVTQLCESADKFGFDYNVVSGAIKQFDNNKLLTIGTVQTFYKLDTPPHFDCVIVDECHTIYRGTINHMQDTDVIFIGCTATPTTKGLRRYYPVLINEVTQEELEQNNILTPLTINQQQYINMDGAIVQAGEWLPSEITERCQSAFDDWIMDSILFNLQSHKHAMAFCASIAHCEALKSRLGNDGITSAIYTSEQNQEDRDTILHDYMNSNTQVLITVATLSKGFDCKLIDLIIDLRPLRQSLAEYMQMIGRGTRVNQGKDSCTVLDFTGNWYRFGDKVLEIRSKGVESAYNSTWDEIDVVASTEAINRYQAAKKIYSESDRGRAQQERIDKLKNEILELNRLAKLKRQNKKSQPRGGGGVFSRIINWFRGTTKNPHC